MRVAIVRSKSPAGIEPRVDREARALARAGHEIHVLLWDRKIEYEAEEKREGYVIHRCRTPAPEGQIGLLPRMARWWCWELRTLLRLRPDVVHSCDFDTALPAAFYAKLKGRRFVYDIFDFYAYMIAQPLGAATRGTLARFERYAANLADLVILADKARVVQLGLGFKGRIVEILNVPEEVQIQEGEGPDFTVFYGGMISEERGLRELVEATALAGVKLVVAGHGADEASLVPIFQKSPHVRFLGSIPYGDVLKWTARCQLIAALYDPAIPNNRLASPNKLFEAMMLSKPVVTNGEIRPAKMVEGVGCGFVVRYGDIQGLADGLRQLAANLAMRREMGARGRMAFEERFNWPIMEKRLVAAYASL
jgi:glycosyltransferase involved in cell wall biosynthesis